MFDIQKLGSGRVWGLRGWKKCRAEPPKIPEADTKGHLQGQHALSIAGIAVRGIS